MVEIAWRQRSRADGIRQGIEIAKFSMVQQSITYGAIMLREKILSFISDDFYIITLKIYIERIIIILLEF